MQKCVIPKWVDVNPEGWIVEKNIVKSCLMCSIQKDMKRITSPDWDDQPAPADRCSCHGRLGTK